MLIGLGHVSAISFVGDAVRRQAAMNAPPCGDCDPHKVVSEIIGYASPALNYTSLALNDAVLSEVAQIAKQQTADELSTYLTEQAAATAEEARRLEDLHNAHRDLAAASTNAQVQIADKTVDVVRSAVDAQKAMDLATSLGKKVASTSTDAFKAKVQAQVDAASLDVARREYEQLNEAAEAAEARANRLRTEAEQAQEALDNAHETREQMRLASEKAAERAELLLDAANQVVNHTAATAVKNVAQDLLEDIPAIVGPDALASVLNESFGLN